MNDFSTFYNLPKKGNFCQVCVISNQRPASYPEFKHKEIEKNAKYMNIDEKGVCDACKQAKIKKRLIGSKEKKIIKTIR